MKPQTISKRLAKLPAYLFAELDRKKTELRAKGVDVIDLGIGDPDLPPPPKMIAALQEGIKNKEYSRYPSYLGAMFFREAISKWLHDHHSVVADPKSEILVLIGSKEGLAALPQTVLNPGDTAIITDPRYPVHLESMILAGANPYHLKAPPENGFLPDLGSVPKKIWQKTKLLLLNYPNNPTSAVATEDLFKEALALAKKYNFLICQDAAYIDICLEGKKQPSILSLPNAKKYAVEFYSFSKMFNICGWRIGFCAGNKDVVSSLGRFKMTFDSGQFTAIQYAVSVGLRDCMGDLQKTLQEYKKRKKIICNGLEAMGLDYHKSNSTFYVWARVPKNYDSKKYASHLLNNHGVVAAPGVGFGTIGDGYIRFSLTAATDRIIEAGKRMTSK